MFPSNAEPNVFPSVDSESIFETRLMTRNIVEADAHVSANDCKNGAIAASKFAALIKLKVV